MSKVNTNNKREQYLLVENSLLKIQNLGVQNQHHQYVQAISNENQNVVDKNK